MTENWEITLLPLFGIMRLKDILGVFFGKQKYQKFSSWPQIIPRISSTRASTTLVHLHWLLVFLGGVIYRHIRFCASDKKILIFVENKIIKLGPPILSSTLGYPPKKLLHECWHKIEGWQWLYFASWFFLKKQNYSKLKALLQVCWAMQAARF